MKQPVNFDILPDGSLFGFWNDNTSYARAYHVARQHPRASDANDGNADTPFVTINRAARVLEPGDKVIVHAGVYRECVRPLRGGTAADRMIAYESAPGERVVISASEPWQPSARPSEGWELPRRDNGATIYMADLPVEVFQAYNPFLARDAYDYIFKYGYLQDANWARRTLRRRGMIFYQGKPLRQVYFARELVESDGTFWVEEPGTRVHFRLPGDVEPGETLDITTREQTFAPSEHGLGYIRVSGFTLMHAADCLPVPQHASISTKFGHHWIIEDCHVDWANACGMSIGCESWDAVVPEVIGHHIIRRNHVTNCGVCGIVGARGVVDCLIEDNVIEHIGHLNLERMSECAGIKFHCCENSLLRGNVIRYIRRACGLWLDVDNINNRITNNVFADITTLIGAVYSEMSFDRNIFDHNVIWDVRVSAGEPEPPGTAGSGLRCDCNENAVVVNNLFGKIEGETIMFSLEQADRKNRRTGLCRANTALNNVLVGCPHQVHLGRREENVSDGNLFDAGQDNCSFRIRYPEPGNFQNLNGWRQYFDLDLHSTQAEIIADFDVDTLTLTWSIVGDPPVCQPFEVAESGEWRAESPEPHHRPVASDAKQPKPGPKVPFTSIVPGPFSEEEWRKSLEGTGSQRFPILIFRLR